MSQPRNAMQRARDGIAPPGTFVTDRLVLRRPRLTDAPAVYEYARDPEVTRYLVFPTHTSLADAENFLRTCEPRWESGSVTERDCE